MKHFQAENMKLEILDDKIIFNGVEYYPKEPEQKTININGHLVPEPVRSELSEGTIYFIPNIGVGNNRCADVVWRYDHYDKAYLSNGLIHLSQEAAIKHAEALLSFTRKG